MAVLLDQKYVSPAGSETPQQTVLKELIGFTFYDVHLPSALKQSQDYAQRGGFVASLPQLLYGRSIAPLDNEIWTGTFTAFSEEIIGKDSSGKDVLIVVHGGGILSTPERIRQAYRDILTENRAAKLYHDEITNFLDGKLPDGTEIPVYSFEEFKTNTTDLPKRYAVVLDLNKVKSTKSGNDSFYGLSENPLFITRVGGYDLAKKFLEKFSNNRGRRFGNMHTYEDIDTYEPQGKLLFLGKSSLGVNNNVFYHGNFVSVDPDTLEIFLNHTQDDSLEGKVQSL